MKAKITYLGQEIQPRDRRGRYGAKKRSRHIRFILAIAIFGISLYAFNANFDTWYDNEVSYIAPTPVYAGITMEAKVENLKKNILDDLEKCESAGYKEEDGIIVFDSNRKASIGTFQFQKTTVIHYYKVLYGQEITAKDAALIALDSEKSRQLAHDIIFDVKGGVWNWENCANSTGIVPEITVIKKLTQN